MAGKPITIRFRRMKGKLGLAHKEKREIIINPDQSEISTESDKFSYGEDAPHNWSQGFVVLTFDKSGMLLEPEFCRVINGKPYFRGEIVV